MSETEDEFSYETAAAVQVSRRSEAVDGAAALAHLRGRLDSQRGLLLSSTYEFPGRYGRWDIGFCDPPLCIEGRGRHVRITALNQRGQLLLQICSDAVDGLPAIAERRLDGAALELQVKLDAGRFSEEQRTRQPSVFSVLRALIAAFHSPHDRHLGLYGAFGYDLVLQFEPLVKRHRRQPEQRDLVLYLPDDLIVVDHRTQRAERLRYNFQLAGQHTGQLPRQGSSRAYSAQARVQHGSDHATGEYEDTVRTALAAFARGDLFEVTPSQTFTCPCPAAPSQLFERLQRQNPAPYGFMANLGEQEYLVGASPEMFVRVRHRRVESCPIAGTIARGKDALGDAEQIRTLLCSTKEEAELTMCTDVDRNDKARVCEPGSVSVIGRRQIEMYSRLIHTVDHVEGRLREGYDALDAFLTHCWAVTLTGAPKAAAMQFIEDHEKDARRFYGGAIGMLGFDGGINTGITLRTVHICDGVARVRAGATLLHDSDPDAERRECELKASALLHALASPEQAVATAAPLKQHKRRVLLVDHRDSFVHTLADYFRQLGAEVTTLRSGFDPAALAELDPELVVLSPGPGRPRDFDCERTLRRVLTRRIPVFGVCLGLQAITEYFGGELGQLPTPVHGKPSTVRLAPCDLFEGLGEQVQVGRYHSLFAKPELLPACLRATAHTGDGCIMALEHRELPIAAVQFHPESIMSATGQAGLPMLNNVLRGLGPAS